MSNGGGPLAAVGYTVIWYGVPVVLFVAYTLFFGRGQGSHALTTLSAAAPTPSTISGGAGRLRSKIKPSA